MNSTLNYRHIHILLLLLVFWVLSHLFGSMSYVPFSPQQVHAQESDFSAMEDEYVSPNDGWGELDVQEEEEESLPLFLEILLWPVNRVLDLSDIVRADVGLGTGYGGVIRMTRSGSLGYRHMSPALCE